MKGIFNLIKFIIRLVIRIIQIVIIGALIAIALIVYAGEIEPRMLMVNSYEIQSKHVTPSLEGMKIVQLSDIHLGENYSLQQLKRVVSKVNELEPDIIVFTGDLVDDHSKFNEVEETIAILKKLHAKEGKFAVYGNHDHGASGTQRYKNMMTKAGFQMLMNSSYSIEKGKKEYLTLFGLDDMLLGNPNSVQTFEKLNPGHFNIFLSHEPDIADKAKKYSVDLQLSGHSHGGQIRIPFIGSPITPKYAHIYIKGMYTFQDNERMHLYVNNGIGTTQMKYRFMNVPEVAVFTLRREKSK